MSKVALIIGGTGGLGGACAKELAQHDFKVVVAGRNKVKGDEAVQAIKKEGGEAAFLTLDIKDDASIAKLHQDVLATYGRLDVAVNGAGILHEQVKFGDVPREALREVLDINLTGVLICMQEQLRVMRTNPGGSSGQIINFTSIYGSVGVKRASAYSATKHALNGITKSAALEYGNENIRVNSLAPGLIMTELVAHLDPTKMPDSELKTDLLQMVARYPLARLGSVEDVAKGVRYLAESDWVTGSVLQIDGGYTAG